MEYFCDKYDLEVLKERVMFPRSHGNDGFYMAVMRRRASRVAPLMMKKEFRASMSSLSRKANTTSSRFGSRGEDRMGNRNGLFGKFGQDE